MRFDSFVDWVVHTAFFVGLGIGVERVFDEPVWTWLGAAAAIGGTINYFLGFWLDARDRARQGAVSAAAEPAAATPRTVGEWILFAFRELSRADFCFIVLALAIADGLWLLLPAGAVGAQAYWMTRLFRCAREFHV